MHCYYTFPLLYVLEVYPRKIGKWNDLWHGYTDKQLEKYFKDIVYHLLKDELKGERLDIKFIY